MDGGRKRGLTDGAGEWEPMERTRSDNANEHAIRRGGGVDPAEKLPRGDYPGIIH